MTDVTVRPLPEPSELTREFWAAAARHELVVPECAVCHRRFFTPQVACPYCGSEEWSYQPSAGNGTIYSATVVYRPPLPAFEAPYCLAVIDLDDGWSMLSRVVGCEPTDVAIGMRVAVAWDDAAPGVALPVFTIEGAT